jgi:hypothetical protein
MSAGATAAHGILSTGVFVLVLVYFLLNTFRVPAPCEAPVCSDASSNVTDTIADECFTANNCSLPYYYAAENVCRPLAAPAGTACQDACYEDGAESTQCDAHGVCTGNATDCRGHCTLDSQCNTTIPLNSFWLPESGNLFDGLQLLWNYLYECQYNKCELFTLDLYYESEAGNTARVVTAYAGCLDFLDTTWSEERASCLIVEDFLLDTNFTNAFYPPENLQTQYRMCTFMYACATFNETAYTKKRSEPSRADYLQDVARRLLQH